MTNDCKTCPVSTGTHKPAEALHQQIAEPQPTALGYADAISAGLSYTAPHILALAADELRAQHTRIAELEGQLDAIGAGGVEPLRKQAAAPQAVQAAVPLPLLLRDIARDLGITVPEACNALKPLGNYSTNSAVTAEMARMLREHFPAPARPAEGVPVQSAYALEDDGFAGYLDGQVSRFSVRRADGSHLAWVVAERHVDDGEAIAREIVAALNTTHPTQQGLDAEYQRGYQDGYNRRDAEVKGALV